MPKKSLKKRGNFPLIAFTFEKRVQAYHGSHRQLVYREPLSNHVCPIKVRSYELRKQLSGADIYIFCNSQFRNGLLLF
jgi:hypothetical protein